MGKSLADQLVEKNIVDPGRYVKNKKTCHSPSHHHHPKYCTGCPMEEQCVQDNLRRKYGN